MAQLKEYIRALPSCPVNFDQSIIGLDQRSYIKEQMRREEDSLNYKESITLSSADSSLAKLIKDKQIKDIREDILASAPQFLYFNYDMITKVIETCCSQTSEILQDVQPSYLINQLEILEALAEGIEYVKANIEKNPAPYKGEIIGRIILDLAIQVGGFYSSFIRSYFSSLTMIELQERQLGCCLRLAQILKFYFSTALDHRGRDFKIINFYYNYYYTLLLFMIQLQELHKNAHWKMQEIVRLIYDEFMRMIDFADSFDNLRDIELQYEFDFLYLILRHCPQTEGFAEKLLYVFAKSTSPYAAYLLLQTEVSLLEIHPEFEVHSGFQHTAQKKVGDLIEIFDERCKKIAMLYSRLWALEFSKKNAGAQQLRLQIDAQMQDHPHPEVKLNIWRIKARALAQLLESNKQFVFHEFDANKQSYISNFELWEQIDQRGVPRVIRDFLDFFVALHDRWDEAFVGNLSRNIQKYAQQKVNNVSLLTQRLTPSFIRQFMFLEKKEIYFGLLDILLSKSDDQEYSRHLFKVILDLITYVAEQKKDIKQLVFLTKLLSQSCICKQDRLKRTDCLNSPSQMLQTLFEQKDKRDYDIYLGTEMTNQIFLKLSQFTDLVSREMHSLFLPSLNRSTSIADLIEIHAELAYLIYILFWKLKDRRQLQLKAVLDECNQLSNEFYKLSINFCYFLDDSKYLKENVHQILDSLMIVGVGFEYYDIMKRKLWEQPDKLASHYAIRQNRIQIIYNTYFEMVYSLLFEVISDGIDRGVKIFYLTFLNSLIDYNIQASITFPEILPKFIFYLRLERIAQSEDSVAIMKEIIMKILIMNGNMHSIRQLFELFSLHQSTFLQNDLLSMKLEPDTIEQLENAYQKANLPFYRIPIFIDIQRSKLIPLVDDSKNYPSLIMNTLDIFLQAFERLNKEAKADGKSRNKFLFFQGNGSYLQIKDVEAQSKEFKIFLTIKFYFSQTTDSRGQAQDSKAPSFIQASFIDQSMIFFPAVGTQILSLTTKGSRSMLTLTIDIPQTSFTLTICSDNTTKNQVYKLSEIDQNKWYELIVEFANQQFSLIVNRTRIQANQQLKFNFELNGISELTLGQNSEEDNYIVDEKFQSITKSFMNCSFINGDNQQLNASIQNFFITVPQRKNQQDIVDSPLFRLNLAFFDSTTGPIQSQKKFINSQFLLMNKVFHQNRLFMYDERVQKKFICESQNLQIIDTKASIEMIVQNGGVSLFYMVLDGLDLVNKSIGKSLDNNLLMQGLIKVVNITNLMVRYDEQLQQNFKENGQEIFKHIIGKWIKQCESFHEKLYVSLINLVKAMRPIQFKTIIQLMDYPFVPDAALAKLENEITQELRQKMLEIPSLLETLRNLNVQYQARQIISLFTFEIGNIILKDVKGELSGPNVFFSRELFACKFEKRPLNSQFRLDIQKYRLLTEFIKANPITLVTYDLLQILHAYFQCLDQQLSSAEFNKIFTQDDVDFKPLILKFQYNFKSFEIASTQNYSTSHFYDKFVQLIFQLTLRVKLYQLHTRKTIDIKEIFEDVQNFQGQIGDCTIQAIFQAFDEYFEHPEIQKQILELINRFYKYQLISDKLKETITLKFADFIRISLLPNQQNSVQHQNSINLLLQYEELPSLLQNLIPSQTIDIRQSAMQQSQSRSFDIFVFLFTYQMEKSCCHPEVLFNCYNKKNFLNKQHTVQLFFEITFTQIQQLLAILASRNLLEQERVLADSELGLLPKVQNVFFALLHIERFIDDIGAEMVRWEYFWKLIEKSMTLFCDLNLLFAKVKNDQIYKFPGITQKENWEWTQERSKPTKRIEIPNGGVRRLFEYLIGSNIMQPGSCKVLSQYLTMLEKDLEAKSKQQQGNQPKATVNYNSDFFYQNLECMVKEMINEKITNQNQAAVLMPEKIRSEPVSFYCFLGYQILLASEELNSDEENQCQKQISELQAVVEVLGQKDRFQKIDASIKKYFDFFYNFEARNSDFTENKKELMKQYQVQQQEVARCFESWRSSQQIPLPSLKDIISHNNGNEPFKKVLYYIAGRQHLFIHSLWKYLTQIKETQLNQDNSLEAQQVSCKTINSQRSNSSTQEYRQVQRNKMEELWKKIDFEMKLKNSLWYFQDESLELLYVELNKFLVLGEFNFEIFDQMQSKYQIRPLEDSIRRRQQLQQIRQNNIKPYLKSSRKKVERRRKFENHFDSSGEKSPGQSSKLSPLYEYCEEEFSLSQSVTQISKRRTSQRSANSLIQPELIQSSQKLRKVSDEPAISDSLINFECEYITQEGAIFGNLHISQQRDQISFISSNVPKPKNDDSYLVGSLENIELKDQIMIKIDLTTLKKVFSRRFLLQEVAVELFAERITYFFNFFNQQQRNQFFNEVEKCKTSKSFQIIKNRQDEFRKGEFTKMWKEGKISNFEYLMTINTYSGRSYNDLNQYFVFPWVIKEYQTQSLDLRRMHLFRDLGVPVGATHKSRLNQIQERYRQRNPQNKDENMMYGSHYSNSTVVINYLLRLEPFNELHFQLQKQKFDVADRLFSSIDIMWENSKHYDQKELIPEFYYMPEFLQNINKFDFGVMQSKVQVSDVQLPRWVKTKTAEEFVFQMRMALESDHVSSKLNEWIDLIFGINSYGPKAENANNVFHYLTYEQNVDLSKRDKETESQIAQISFYGQTPKQIFFEKHPKRNYNLPMYTNDKPEWDLKQELYTFKSDQQSAGKETLSPCILQIFTYSSSNVFLVFSDFTVVSLEVEKLFVFQLVNEDKYKQIQRLSLGEVNQDKCNPQNLFCFVYFEPSRFYDKVDSQYHSCHTQVRELNSLFLAVGGYLDNSIKLWEMKPKKGGTSPITLPQKHKKRVSCLKFHSHQDTFVLVAGSLDCTISVYRLNRSFQFAANSIFVITQHKNPILCVDVSDLYILSVDSSQIVYVHTIEGESLQQIQIFNDCPIMQCQIHPAQFFVFKSSKSNLHVYTFNGSPYIINYDMQLEQSQNIVFLTPCSTCFLLYSSQYSYVYIHDIFELKLIQQGFSQRLNDKIDLEMIDERVNGMKKQNRQKSRGVTSFHITFDYDPVDPERKFRCQCFYLVSLNGTVYWLKNMKDLNEMLKYHIQQAGLGTK